VILWCINGKKELSMKSELEFIVNTIKLSGNGGMVEVDTTILITDKMECQHDGLHRQFCNFIITYEEYIRLHLKVGDCIRMDIKRIISHVKQKEQ